MTKQLTSQQLLALDYKKNISLVANAGSGKTFVLSKRFVEIYVNENVDLDSIVAITFTDKAAGELQKKISLEIEEQLQNTSDRIKKNKLEKLRQELVSANISTIHSFCINLLKENAPEAEIDANFYPIDQQTANELIELALEETIQNLLLDNNNSSDVKYLVRLFGSTLRLKSILSDAIQKRRAIEKLSGHLYSNSENEIADYFKTQFEQNVNKLLSRSINQLVNSVSKINSNVQSADNSNKYSVAISEYLNEIKNNSSLNKVIHFLSLIKKEILTTEGSIRTRGYIGKERYKFESEIYEVETIFDEISLFFECRLSGDSEIELAAFGKSFINVFNKISRSYNARKKSKSYLDFEDILLFTHKIIGKTEVQKYLSEKYKFIMVDEYQDTNELQYEIIMPILNHLKRGNLFVVGDEKQSIYMFREADLEIFDRTKNDINRLGDSGNNLNLPHSFRMFPKLVLFTNTIFARLFANPRSEFNEVKHSDLICTKPDQKVGGVEIILADSEREIEESIIVANKILELIKNDSTIKFSDIAILCRKRDSFSSLETCFTKMNIPFNIIGGKGFYQRQTIYDIYNYISFLLTPQNDSALIGILRSPFFNYSDTRLLLISEESGNSFYEKLKNHSKKQESIKNSIELLENHRLLAYSQEPNKLIRQIMLDSGYWAFLSAGQDAHQELANLDKLISIAREHTRKGFKNLFDFALYLKESIEGTEDEGQAQIIQDDDSIKIMTIHQSKGLEFNVVFIYDTNTKTQNDNIRARSISIDKDLGILTKVPLQKKYFEKFVTPPVVAYYNYLSRKKNDAELKRLFYVAVTRAVKYLFISGTHKEFKATEGSFFQLLQKGLQGDLSQNEIMLEGNVEFLKMENEKLISLSDRVELKIGIIHDVDAADQIIEKEKPAVIEKRLLNGKIIDLPENEIISATKVCMYEQCPVKYELTYELGYSPILKLIKESESIYEFQPNEEESSAKFAQLRGKIIHKALSGESFPGEVRKFLHNELIREEFDALQIDRMIDSLQEDLENFFKTKCWQELKNVSKYENEFEVYCKDGNSFLYGIIDKLIYENDSLTIIDYKTDSVKENKLTERAESYFPQLKFYAYVLNKLYPNVDKFKLRLIFLKHPDEIFIKTIDKKELIEFSSVIGNAADNIYKQNFIPKTSHCSQCQFAMEGNKCIKLIM